MKRLVSLFSVSILFAISLADDSSCRAESAGKDQALSRYEQRELDYAQRLEKLGAAGLARRVYKDLIKEEPEAPGAEAAAFALARNLLQEKQYDQSRDAFEAFLRNYPYSKKRWEAEFWIAEIAYRVGDYETALRDFKRLSLKKEAQAAGVAARAKYNLAWCYKAKGDLKAAASAFRSFLLVYGDSPLAKEAWLALGDVLEQRGDFRQARTAYRAATEKGYDNETVARAWIGVAHTSNELKDTKTALKAARRVETLLDSGPLLHRARYESCRAYCIEGNPVQALVIAARMFPGDEWTDLALEVIGESLVKANISRESVSTGKDLSALAIARYRMKRKEWDQAIPLARTVAEQASDKETRLLATRYLAEALGGAGKWEDAARTWAKLAEMLGGRSGAVDALRRAALAFQTAGKPKEAKKVLENLLSALSDSSEATKVRYEIAELLDKQGQHAEAARYFALAAQSGDGDLAKEAQLKQAYALFDAGEYARASECAMRFAERYSSGRATVAALLIAADSALRMKKWDEAVSVCLRALEKAEDPDMQARIYYNLGVAYEEKGQPIDARAAYAQAVKVAPTGEIAGDALYREGVLRFKEGDEKAAADVFKRLLRDYPETEVPTETVAWLAQYVMDHESLEDAAKLWKRVLAQARKSKDVAMQERAYYEIGHCLFLSKDYAKAVAVYTELLKSSPRSAFAPQALADMVECYVQMKQHRRAFETLQQLRKIARGPMALKAELRAGQMYAVLGKPVEAEKVLRRALILYEGTGDPETIARIKLALGKILTARGQRSEAKKVFLDIFRIKGLDPHSPIIREARRYLVGQR